MRILSIQSSVAYGHVGNSAATFPLQRLGHEVWPVNTVHFSNHTGYGAWRGEVMAPEVVADVIRGIDERGALGDVDAVLTGYQGSPGVAEVVLDTVERVYEREGKLVEKYALRGIARDAPCGGGGGEYPLQDGFGWTNGVSRRWLQETAGGR